MVSFSCEVCNDTVVKKKLQQHQYQCRGSYFTCIDCSTTFYDNDHVKHTSCISEAEKYEKSLFKGKKKNAQVPKRQPQSEITAKSGNVTEKKKEEKKPVKSTSKDKREVEDKKVVKKKKEGKEKKAFELKKYIGSEPTSLYKIFKSAKKDNKDFEDKTRFLKNVKVIQNEDDTFTFSV
ncbi:hypothetical protein CANINC_001790 [Pichia inconspicua]|uniref:Zinc finger C2H2 LYAR-type domain-containing protein n=1 Tax=Pichia inconspicua TaxID=52247 RepID=A0A4T0X2X2_9ASCO|nr:hypothetical protein CANINC_001790 [[Candida] inconspicua]